MGSGVRGHRLGVKSSVLLFGGLCGGCGCREEERKGGGERRRGEVKGVEGGVRTGWLRDKGGGFSLKLLLTVLSVSKCCYDHSLKPSLSHTNTHAHTR